MENKTEPYQQKEKSKKMMFDVILFFYQLESMLKNHSSMLSEKIAEGDLISSSIAFNNALILSNLKRILKENPEFESYSNSEEFQEKLKTELPNEMTRTVVNILLELLSEEDKEEATKVFKKRNN